MSSRIGHEQITARLRGLVRPPTSPPPAAVAPPTAPASDRPWLTAEAAMPPNPPPVTGQDGGLQSNVSDPAPASAVPEPARPGSRPPPASGHRPAPEGSSPPARRPKRRRWAAVTGRADRRAEVDPPAAERYLCPFCHRRHQPIPMGGGGLAAIAGTVLLADHYASDGRPTPLGRGDADTSSLRRDAFNPWRGSTAELPPTRAAMTFRDRVAGLWYGDEA